MFIAVSHFFLKHSKNTNAELIQSHLPTMRPTLLLSLFTLVHSTSAAISYIEAFQELQDSDAFVWPTPSSPTSDYITSTFGPRLMASSKRYDFHRGVDIQGEEGDIIVAPYTGVVETVTTYSGGGLTVILKHEFADQVLLHDDKPSTSRFYTVFMHLQEALVEKGGKRSI